MVLKYSGQEGRRQMRYSARTYIVLFLGVFALSSSAIFVRLAQSPSSVTAFYRMLFTVVALLPLLLFSAKERSELKDWSVKEWLMASLSGVIVAADYVIWFESLRFTSVASSTVLVALQPLFSILFGYLFLSEKTDRTQLTGCAIAIVGSVIIGGGDMMISGKALFGDLLALIAAALIPLYFLIGQVIRRQRSAATYSVISYSASTVALFLYVLLKGDSFTGYPAGTWWSLVGLAVIATVGGQFVFTLLLRKIPATAVTMSILGEPVGTIILAFFLLGERISLQQFIGIVLILAGLGITSRKPETQSA